MNILKLMTKGIFFLLCAPFLIPIVVLVGLVELTQRIFDWAFDIE